MRISSPVARRRPRIEIIPLIDIVFFLLATFVMVSLSMVKNQGIAVRLPKAATGTTQERRQMVTLSLTEAGELFFNRDPIALEDLPDRLAALKAEDSELRVFLNGDEAVPFGSAIKILDMVREQGITNVSIQTVGAAPSGVGASAAHSRAASPAAAAASSAADAGASPPSAAGAGGASAPSSNGASSKAGGS